MEKLRIHVCATDVHVTQLGRLTTGMVGATASFSFSAEWDGLLKTAVFVGTAASKDVILTENTVEIPPECLAKRGSLQVGVYGMLEDGTVVIPSVMSEQCEVKDGANPSGDTQSGYTPDKWAQMLGMIGDISHLTTEAKSSLVAAINELAARSGGEVDPAEVQRIVQEYLAANPPQVTETDPTVPEWAKQPQKPTYTADEVGAVCVAVADWGMTSCDKTIEELTAAYEAGVIPVLLRADARYDFAQYDGGFYFEKIDVRPHAVTISRCGIHEDGSMFYNDTYGEYRMTVNGKYGEVTLTAADVGALPDDTEIPVVPTRLPNPNTLTFTGAVEASYDGSQPISVEIPSGGGGESYEKADEVIATGTIATGSSGLIETGMTWGQLKAYKEFALIIASVGGNTNFSANSSWRIRYNTGHNYYGLPALCFLPNSMSGSIARVRFVDEEKKIYSIIDITGTAYNVRNSKVFTEESMFHPTMPTGRWALNGELGYVDLSKVGNEIGDDSPIAVYFSAECTCDYIWKALGVFK